MKEEKFNSEQLHIISSLSIDVCRLIWKENYLPPKTTLDVITKYHKGIDFHKKLEFFKLNWFKYRDNRDYMLDTPFTEKGFKVKRKVSFILKTIDPSQRNEILSLWEKKKELLLRQLSF